MMYAKNIMCVNSRDHLIIIGLHIASGILAMGDEASTGLLEELFPKEYDESVEGLRRVLNLIGSRLSR